MREAPKTRKKAMYLSLTVLDKYHPLPGMTAEFVTQILRGWGCRYKQKGIESRLCELVRFGLATSNEDDHPRFKSYSITERGARLMAHPKSELLLRMLTADLTVWENERAIALAPAKEYWEDKITHRMNDRAKKYLG